MEAHQIRLHINELVAGIRDETFLNACYEAVAGIAKAYRQVSVQKNGATPDTNTAVPGEEEPASVEKPQPHDLSLVVLANEVFKGSEPIPPDASIAFRQALLDSATKIPTLPNRL